MFKITSKTEICEKEKQAVQAYLKKVNGNAKAHTFTHHFELVRAANEAESRLAELQVAKKNRSGIRMCCESGSVITSKKYKSDMIRTKIIMVRNTDGWRLLSAQKHLTFPDDKKSMCLFMSRALKEDIAHKLLSDIICTIE